MSMRKTIGVIGGSGLYELAGIENLREVALTTPFGAPSDSYMVGELPEDGVQLVFLPRHGRGHRLLPSEINYAANIYGLKQLGAEYVLSVSAVGSLREHIRPGDIVTPDQLVDRTKSRRSTFFGDGVVGHVAFADPVCGTLRKLVGHAAAQVVTQAGDKAPTVHPSGTHLVIEGPAFSTRAESLSYRALGADIIGMTNLPEAKLAREAELCYAIVALPTDYDCWREDEEAVSVEAVVALLHRNVAMARQVVRATARLLGAAPPRSCSCANAVQHAVMTAPDKISPEAYARLERIIGRYIAKPQPGR